MGQQEGPIEQYLVDEVKRLGGRSRKVQWVGRDGAPDRLVWWPGPRIGFVELKSATGALSGPQRRELQRLRDDGWSVFVPRTREDVDLVLQTIRSRHLI